MKFENQSLKYEGSNPHGFFTLDADRLHSVTAVLIHKIKKLAHILNLKAEESFKDAFSGFFAHSTINLSIFDETIPMYD